MSWKLSPHPAFSGPRGPVVLAILDGVGIGLGDEADAVCRANTPVLDRLRSGALSRSLAAHGRAVGLPSDADMGNSEVGHNAMGCGRVYDQGALLVNRAIESGDLFRGETWRRLLERTTGPTAGALHFVGLLSDGNVHSHIRHLIAMLRNAAGNGVKTVFVHALLDGRDVSETSALEYIDAIEPVFAELAASGIRAGFASGGGRMVTTMDRYEADWSIVERGYNAHVHGIGRQFSSAREAVETFREESPGISDQFLPPFRPGDAVVNFNFRGDRAIQFSTAMEAKSFDKFDRGDHPDAVYAGMMEYDGDLHVPGNFLVDPPAIERTMGEYLAQNGVAQLAISETQKYGHVTYFWNGNRTGMFSEDVETYVEIPSDTVPFEERPWMKSAEITDRLIAELATDTHRFARVNYANGDMVGHTGHLDATIVALEAVDLQLGRLVRAVRDLDGILVVTADHGNADEMIQHDKHGGLVCDRKTGKPMVKTSHTLNPVPFMIFDSHSQRRFGVIPDSELGAGITSVTATCFELLGFAPPEGMDPSLVRFL